MKQKKESQNVSIISIGYIIWLLFSMALTYLLISGAYKQAILITIVLYAISIGIGLSPIGEWLFRIMSGAHKIRDPQDISTLSPIFDVVYEKAKQKSPWLSDKVKIYMVDDPTPNAAAIGKNTIFVNSGLFNYANVEEVKGILGHEFGHLAYGDTLAAMLAVSGNFVLMAILFLLRVFLKIIIFFSSFEKDEQGNKTNPAHWFSQIMLNLLNFVSNIFIFVGISAAMASSRKMEYRADRYSLDLGYGNGLISFFNTLDELENGPNRKIIGRRKLGIVEALTASHPRTELRIQKIQQVIAGTQIK